MRDMNLDVDLLCRIIDTETATVKQLAFWSDKSCDTIYAYRSGRIPNIPTGFWRRILPKLREVNSPFAYEIPSLILGDCECSLVFDSILPDVRSPGCATALLRAHIAACQTEQYLAELFADGRIDEADRERLQAYENSFIASQVASHAIHKAVMRICRQNGARP